MLRTTGPTFYLDLQSKQNHDLEHLKPDNTTIILPTLGVQVGLKGWHCHPRLSALEFLKTVPMEGTTVRLS